MQHLQLAAIHKSPAEKSVTITHLASLKDAQVLPQHLRRAFRLYSYRHSHLTSACKVYKMSLTRPCTTLLDFNFSMDHRPSMTQTQQLHEAVAQLWPCRPVASLQDLSPFELQSSPATNVRWQGLLQTQMVISGVTTRICHVYKQCATRGDSQTATWCSASVVSIHKYQVVQQVCMYDACIQCALYVCMIWRVPI